jgi:hypothetical protein
VTRNTRSSQTIGDECPQPLIGVFQQIFSPVLPFHRTGTSVSALDPSPRGPRQQGQFSATAAAVRRMQIAKAIGGP